MTDVLDDHLFLVVWVVVWAEVITAMRLLW